MLRKAVSKWIYEFGKYEAEAGCDANNLLNKKKCQYILTLITITTSHLQLVIFAQIKHHFMAKY